MEEAKPQRDPQTASSVFLKSHPQLSVKFRNFSQRLGQLCFTFGSVSPVKFPFHGKGRRGLLDRHEWIHTCTAQLLTASAHPHPGHPAKRDFTPFPQLKHKYGNYTRREGISLSSRLKNNSWLMKHKGKFISRAGFEQESTEAKGGSAWVCQNAGKG